MFGISGAGYDFSTSVFSPDGRIFAAEYAKKAVEQGATSIGILVKDGVVLLAEKRVEPLHEPDSIEKISKVDDHVGVATSGLMADARRLIEMARIKAQSYWLTYEEPIPAEALADHICDIKSMFTQGGGGRPFGVAMIIGAVDLDGRPKLYVTDPTGTLLGFLATVIGRGSSQAGELLEKKYNRTMSMEDATRLALEALKQASEAKMTPDNIEIAHIAVSDRKFHKLSREEIEQILSQPKVTN
ncbi:MAG: archaeal proteasome endopeptidase complex subunit alpha [Candidatus Thorarchaeota archaeon]|nr:archaeal proteasome endopeptidase complex subunit alpha [Candidatus Thorarchaeota archaeon]